ncbi:MAG: ABC transporter ATP-binding protein [Nocardioidaceae bacterium]
MRSRPDRSRRAITASEPSPEFSAGHPRTPPFDRPRHDHGGRIDVRGLTWRPLRRRKPVLEGLNLNVPAGQRVLLAGPSGAGKSTLLRAIAGLLLTADHGEVSGSVTIDGHDVADGAAAGRPVGLLLQDPYAGIVAETVGRDVAFGLENQRVPRARIWPTVQQALNSVSFPYGLDHPTAALSGGETQRLALAGSLGVGSRVLLLDEPTSMLDPDSATAVRAAVRCEVERHQPTTIIVEHHLEPWIDFADRLIVLDRRGSIVADGKPSELLDEVGPTLAALGLWVPGQSAPALVDVDPELVGPWAPGPEIIVRASDLRVELRSRLAARGTPSTVALDGVDAVLASGHVLGVTGSSGAGKSTLVAVLAGLLRPTSGSVNADPALATRKGRSPWRWSSRDLCSRLSWVPQTPEHGVVTSSVRDEVIASGLACGREPARLQRRTDAILETLGLSGLMDVSPYHLSGGEQRRLMVAAGLVHGPIGVLLDEPTVGQDRGTWATVLGCLEAARRAGSGVAISTHDAAAAAAVADQRLALSSGRPAT